MKEKFTNFLKNNISVFYFAVFAILTEIVSIYLIGCAPIFTKPLFAISLFCASISFLFLFKSFKVKTILCTICLIIQSVINVGFVFLYDSNGTYFEWAMINQRTDAFGTIEDLSLRWSMVILFTLLVTIYIASSVFIYKKMLTIKTYHYKTNKITKTVFSVILAVCCTFIVLNPTVSAIQTSNDK